MDEVLQMTTGILVRGLDESSDSSSVLMDDKINKLH